MTDIPKQFKWQACHRYDRLDIFLKLQLPHVSRAYAQKLITTGNVAIGGTVVCRCSNPVISGNIVEMTIPPMNEEPDSEQLPLEVLYEDAHIAIVNKQPGVPVHPVHARQKGTLVGALLTHIDNLSDIGGVLRPGIVHRLDRDTSGVMVIAKTNVVHMALSTQFKKREVEKHYLALVTGIPAHSSGIINASITRNPRHRTKMTTSITEGRIAVTHYRVLETWDRWSMVNARPLTGRTHQVRVHLQSIGCFILGDNMYGRKQARDFPIAVPRVMLHALSLAFFHPAQRQWQQYTAPVPPDMQTIIHYLENRNAA